MVHRIKLCTVWAANIDKFNNLRAYEGNQMESASTTKLIENEAWSGDIANPVFWHELEIAIELMTYDWYWFITGFIIYQRFTCPQPLPRVRGITGLDAHGQQSRGHALRSHIFGFQVIRLGGHHQLTEAVPALPGAAREGLKCGPGKSRYVCMSECMCMSMYIHM